MEWCCLWIVFLELGVGQPEGVQVGCLARLLADRGLPLLCGHVPHAAVLVGDAAVVVVQVIGVFDLGQKAHPGPEEVAVAQHCQHDRQQHEDGADHDQPDQGERARHLGRIAGAAKAGDQQADRRYAAEGAADRADRAKRDQTYVDIVRPAGAHEQPARHHDVEQADQQRAGDHAEDLIGRARRAGLRRAPGEEKQHAEQSSPEQRQGAADSPQDAQDRQRYRALLARRGPDHEVVAALRAALLQGRGRRAAVRAEILWRRGRDRLDRWRDEGRRRRLGGHRRRRRERCGGWWRGNRRRSWWSHRLEIRRRSGVGRRIGQRVRQRRPARWSRRGCGALGLWRGRRLRSCLRRRVGLRGRPVALLDPCQTLPGLRAVRIDVENVVQAGAHIRGVVDDAGEPQPALLAALVGFHHLHEQRARLGALAGLCRGDTLSKEISHTPPSNVRMLER